MSIASAGASDVFDLADAGNAATTSSWRHRWAWLGESGRPGGVHGRLAWACAIVAIVAYALVIVIFPAGSLPVLVVANVGAALAAAIAAGLCFFAAYRQAVRRAPLVDAARVRAGLLGVRRQLLAWSEVILGEMPGVPSWADVGYVTMVMLVIAGAALHPISRPREVSRARLLLDTDGARVSRRDVDS